VDIPSRFESGGDYCKRLYESGDIAVSGAVDRVECDGAVVGVGGCGDRGAFGSCGVYRGDRGGRIVVLYFVLEFRFLADGNEWVDFAGLRTGRRGGNGAGVGAGG